MRNKKLSAEKCRVIGATLKEIKRHRGILSHQQLSTLCGQAKAGNPEAALRGLHKVLQEKGVADG